MATYIGIGSERDRAASCGAEAIASIRAAIASPHPQTTEDLDLLYAVRMTRLAVFHAFRAFPALKPRDAYERAKALA